jgi:hypothetical protein
MFTWLKRIEREEGSVPRAAAALPRQQSLWLGKYRSRDRSGRKSSANDWASGASPPAATCRRASKSALCMRRLIVAKPCVRSFHAPIRKRRHLAAEVHDDILQSRRDALQPA